MSKIDQVDLSKPIKFYGCRVVQSDHPSLVLLAAARGDSNARPVWETVGAAAVLVGDEAAALIGFARGTPVGAPIRAALTEGAESPLGEPLLTGGVSFEDFRAFLEAAVLAGAAANPARAVLSGRFFEWAQLGAEEVRFTGYRLLGQAAASPAPARLAAAAGR